MSRVLLDTSVPIGAGAPADVPRYRIVASVPEGQFDDERRSAIVAAVTERVLDADVQEELGILTDEVRAKKAGEDTVISVHASDTSGPSALAGQGTVEPAAAALTSEPPVVPAKLEGLELGPACNQCGGMMQRTGSCYTCPSCGNNTGCG